MPKPRFAGRTAVVTGAARGIGAATALRLSQDGARVLLVDQLDQVEETANAMGQSGLILDLAEPGASASVLAQLDGMDVGPLDILVNNAGIGGSRPLLDSDDAHLLQLIEVNLRAVISLTRDLSPRLRRPGGRVVNVSSIFGMIGNAGTIGYGVAKAGIAQFSRQLATELGPTGITVNAIAPGVVATEMTQEHLKSSRYRQLQVAPIPLGRISQPHEQAAVIAFLASDEASFVSGAVLPVDGGFLATRHAPFSTE